MSLTIVRPPPVIIKTNQESQRVYTLHSTPNHIFAWRTSNQKMKTSAVVFKRHEDALLMAHMIDRHVRQKKEWPSVTMFDFQLEPGPYRDGRPELIEIRPWDMDSLKVYCVRAYLDMVTLSKLAPIETGFKISGELVSLDVPIDFYPPHLNYLLELE